MDRQACAWTAIISIIATALATNRVSAAEAPFAGCYERAYDSAHLFAHPGQIVERVVLSVGAPSVPDRDPRHPIVARALLKIFIHGAIKSFDSIGACSKSGDGLSCSGSLSAAEAPRCKTKADGLRACRLETIDGSFRIDRKPEGLFVTITKPLELVPDPYDAGPFLYLGPKNAENHDFRLDAASDGAACKAAVQ